MIAVTPLWVTTESGLTIHFSPLTLESLCFHRTYSNHSVRQSHLCRILGGIHPTALAWIGGWKILPRHLWWPVCWG